MDKLYYRSYFDYERNHWWFKARSEILKKYILKNISNGTPLRILNVGVATGASTTMLQQFGAVTSLEYERECIDFMKGKVDFEIIQGSILELPFDDNAFDLVCAFDVIEHVEDDQKAVAELNRVCKKDGAVLVTVPALMSLWSEHDEINHHYRRYTRTSLLRVFGSLKGGNVSFASYFNFFLFPMIFIARKLANLKKRKESETLHSDFEKFNTGFLNTVLYRVMKAEYVALSSRLKLGIGVSIFLHWIKKENG